jgi:alpha-methylacyl-CoA racemase
VFASLDACVEPVLAPDEAPAHPHHAARGGFVDRDGLPEPAPAPRFGRTHPAPPSAPVVRPSALTAWGFDDDEVAELVAAGVVT